MPQKKRIRKIAKKKSALNKPKTLATQQPAPLLSEEPFQDPKSNYASLVLFLSLVATTLCWGLWRWRQEASLQNTLPEVQLSGAVASSVARPPSPNIQAVSAQQPLTFSASVSATAEEEGDELAPPFNPKGSPTTGQPSNPTNEENQ